MKEVARAREKRENGMSGGTGAASGWGRAKGGKGVRAGGERDGGR